MSVNNNSNDGHDDHDDKNQNNNDDGKEAAAEQQQPRYISLEIPKALQDEGIVSSFVKDNETYNVVAKLNHKYSEKNIISPIHRMDWVATVDVFEKRAKKKGIKPNHIEMLVETLDKNYDRVLELIKKTEEEPQEATQKKAKRVLELIEENYTFHGC